MRVNPPGMLTAMQVARFCEVDLKTIHNWANKGKIPSTRTTGRHLRFHPLDVLDFLRAYELELPEALVRVRRRVLLIDADTQALSSARRILSRRFELTAFDDIVEGLIALESAAPEVLVLGDIAPLDPGTIATRLRSIESTRHVRIVAVGAEAPGATARVPRGDVAKLREALERVVGIEAER